MALALDVTLPSGVVASYHHICMVFWDKQTTVELEIASFVNVAARESGAVPLARHRARYACTAFPTLADCYAAIKAPVESQGVDGEDNPTVVLTPSPYANATDC